MTTKGRAGCETCDGAGIVASSWPSGYPHATPCPECRPGPCDCGIGRPCPSAEAVEHWKTTDEGKAALARMAVRK